MDRTELSELMSDGDTVFRVTLAKIGSFDHRTVLYIPWYTTPQEYTLDLIGRGEWILSIEKAGIIDGIHPCNPDLYKPMKEKR